MVMMVDRYFGRRSASEAACGPTIVPRPAIVPKARSTTTITAATRGNRIRSSRLRAGASTKASKQASTSGTISSCP